MADVTVFDLTGGAAYDSETTSGITTGAAAQTVPCENGRDQRLALRIQNGDDEAVIATVAAGDGVRSSLGEYALTVAAGETAYIALFDTARYKALADNDIDVTLTDSEGGALESGELLNVQIEAVQL
ncbi:MAG: hypothetical protein PHO15_09035 [Eubacteriales bacterium]|nr:hypothetical protein [Eubacteriales bacterium]